MNDPLDPRTINWEPQPCKIYLDRYCEYFALVDEEDFQWLVESRWTIHMSNTIHARWRLGHDVRTLCYAIRRARAGGERKKDFMHRVIMMKYIPPPTKRHTIVDHINGNRLDNRKANFRWATPRENARNRHGFWRDQSDLFT